MLSVNDPAYVQTLNMYRIAAVGFVIGIFMHFLLEIVIISETGF